MTLVFPLKMIVYFKKQLTLHKGNMVTSKAKLIKIKIKSLFSGAKSEIKLYNQDIAIIHFKKE